MTETSPKLALPWALFFSEFVNELPPISPADCVNLQDNCLWTRAWYSNKKFILVLSLNSEKKNFLFCFSNIIKQLCLPHILYTI